MGSSTYDPFGGVRDEPLEKFHHIHEEKSRVRVKATGHTGVLEAINAHRGHVVRLDSGHHIECHESEIEPEDFPHPERTPAEISRVMKAHDPFPGIRDDDPEPERKASYAALQILAPFLKSSGGLMLAFESGTVSSHDCVLIKTAMDNIKASLVALDPFGETEEHNAYILRIMAEKYSGTSAGTGETFTKAAHSPDTDPEFSVGQMVKDKRTGKKGKIVKLDYGFARVVHNTGEFHCPCGELEAAA